ncbi:MAG TPA: hypothetical protein VMU49_01285 [Candidatus Acidoferrales bacterium]|nr:hypothetical protein [Candidatus Acidoferrales bacterium]
MLRQSFLRREWGAVSFVLAVLVGAVVVPLALTFGHHSTPPPAAATTPASAASSAR